ncbi:hypothetical protein [Alkalibacillus salilacus]|uniref:Uncharacterized protein n=1 Tax=Alkalibacillus salilacus TaxID=284582 RepID=A0ABT9VIN4_9BACI|nr:hypothetical protein [Alkalibacillus salilacus]MDQ0160665.1 hypothetical protein [Alkalibacillus salilacus]
MNQSYIDFPDLVKGLSDETLLKIGKATGSTDFGVRFYYKKQHPKFYKNRFALEKAIKRMWANNAFNHRERTARILDIDLETLR